MEVETNWQKDYGGKNKTSIAMLALGQPGSILREAKQGTSVALLSFSSERERSYDNIKNWATGTVCMFQLMELSW